MLSDELKERLTTVLNGDNRFRRFVAEVLGVKARDVHAAEVVMAQSLLALWAQEEDFERPGWTFLASDVAGMPWPESRPSQSHGTWASHDECGTVQKVSLARRECRTCPPEPHSRTYRAKAEQPQFLYLVRFLDLLKFGHGDANRVRAHVRAGCEVVHVLRGPDRQVVAAELRMKRHFRDRAIDGSQWNLPTSFGTGSEVIEGTNLVSLSRFLAGPQVTDETHRWSS